MESCVINLSLRWYRTCWYWRRRPIYSTISADPIDSTEKDMIPLKQSTASQTVTIGPFLDATDAVTLESGLTIANTDIRLSKAGGNIVPKNSGGGTYDEAGAYTITLDATDTNTVGSLQLYCNMSGALPVYHEFYVFEEAIYDALYGASATGFDSNGRVDVGTILGSAVTASSGIMAVNTTQIEGADATNQINAACDTAVADAALATASALATVDANVDAILDDTGTSGVVLATDAISAAAMSTAAANEIRDAIMAAVVEDAGPGATSIALDDAIAIILAFAAGQATGQATTSPIFLSPDGNENRIQATTDGSGNRSAITLTFPT
jgi:hypothetical protein